MSKIISIAAILVTNMKQHADKHRRLKLFQTGKLVMIWIRKEHLSPGNYHKLKPKKIGPFQFLHKINDNAYLIDIPAKLNFSPTFNVSDIYKYYSLDDPPAETQELETRWLDKLVVITVCLQFTRFSISSFYITLIYTYYYF